MAAGDLPWNAVVCRTSPSVVGGSDKGQAYVWASSVARSTRAGTAGGSEWQPNCTEVRTQTAAGPGGPHPRTVWIGRDSADCRWSSGRATSFVGTKHAATASYRGLAEFLENYLSEDPK